METAKLPLVGDSNGWLVYFLSEIWRWGCVLIYSLVRRVFFLNCLLRLKKRFQSHLSNKKEVTREDFYCFGEKNHKNVDCHQATHWLLVIFCFHQPRCNRHHQDDIKFCKFARSWTKPTHFATIASGVMAVSPRKLRWSLEMNHLAKQFPFQNHHFQVPRFQEISNKTHVSRTPKPEYLITRSQLTWSGVRWDSVPFNFWWITLIINPIYTL